jgi:hypothetical protein
MPTPTSRKLRVRLFARCGELFIQARNMLRGLEVRPPPKPMFSPEQTATDLINVRLEAFLGAM